MFWNSLRTHRTNSKRVRANQSQVQSAQRRALLLEPLEDRCLLSASQLDLAFGVGGTVTTDFLTPAADTAHVVAVQADGKIIEAGRTFGFATGSQWALARYNPDGSLDASFGTAGRVVTDFGHSGAGASVSSLAIQNDGKIIVAGTDESSYALARFNADGSLDTSFDGDGIVSTSSLTNSLVIQSDGKILTAGADYASFVLTRYNPDGSLDASFDGDGVVRLGAEFNQVNGVSLQSDGKIVAVGRAGELFALVRYDSEGSLDTSFGGDGEVTTNFGISYSHASAVAIQADGNIVAAGMGWDYYVPGTYNFAVARYTPDGTLDSSFDVDGKALIDFGVDHYETVRGIAIQADGKIVVTGLSDPAWAFAVARLNPDGSLDATFDGDGKVTTEFGTPYGNRAESIALQADGQILIAGTTGEFDFALVKLNASDGSLDNSFGVGGKVTTTFFTLSNEQEHRAVIQPDGKIVTAGWGVGISNGTTVTLARYNPDGSLDATFGLGGKVSTDAVGGNVGGIALQSDGRIVVSCIDGNEVAAIRYNANGSIDTEFGVQGLARTGLTGDSYSNTVAIEPNGKIVVAGGSGGDFYNGSDFAVARLNVDGTLDLSFGGDGSVRTDLGGRESISGIVIDHDGRIVAAGVSGVARYLDDGSLDTAFGLGGSGYSQVGGGSSVVVDGTNRVIVGGGYPWYDTKADVIRLSSDGSLDTSFGTAGHATIDFGGRLGSINALAIDPSGRIAVAGQSIFLDSVYNSSTDFAVTLLNPDGFLDLGFGTDGKVTTNFANGNFATVNGAIFDSAGRLVVSGYTVNGSYTNDGKVALARYLTTYPILEVNPATIAADLQAAVTALDTVTPDGTPRLFVHVSQPAYLAAFTSALAGLTVNPAGPTIEIILEGNAGDYRLGSVSVPAGVALVLESGLHTLTSSSTPAITLVSGEVVIRSGALLNSTGNTPAILVKGGRLSINNGRLTASGNAPTIQVAGGQVSIRNSTIEETTGGNQAAIAISGGVVDLGFYNNTEFSPGGNTLNIHGPGDLILNAGANPVSAVGNTYRENGQELAGDFRVEDAIDHAMDRNGVGLVSWSPGNVFVSATNVSIQRGVDQVPVGGWVNIETDARGNYSVGTKLLTVAYGDGSSVTQQADSLDPTRTTLVVMGTYGDDSIKFEKGSGNGVRVDMNGLPRGTFHPDGRLIAYGVEGSDRIEVSEKIQLSAWLFGGASGNNILKGGGGNNVLQGGYGDDTLIAGLGRDLLIGDGGADHLEGRSGDTILIGGYWAFGSTYGVYETAVAAIMAEWTSNLDYDTRVNHLINGGGANGYYTLTPSETVYDDGAVDVLTSGTGRDLFFASLLDSVIGRRANETTLLL